MDELEIIITSDGSHTLRNKLLNETYHSIHGALQESMHVFIKSGLEYYHQTHQSENISVLEIGFGTGLNALLAFRYAMRCEVNIHFTTLEPFPLVENVWSKLNYGEPKRTEFDAIHRAPWEQDVLLTRFFTILKRMTSLQNVGLDGRYDVVFFDAFAPSVQPELWGFDALKIIAETMNAGAVFVTYSSKGQVKRDLKALGLQVETLQGPPGKLQMIRATK